MFSNTEKNVYPFRYRAIVIDNKDPKKLGRIRLRVPEVFGQSLITDWAHSKNGVVGPVENFDQGDFNVPSLGERVWCEFESGNPNYPIWSGVYFSETTLPPKLAREIKDETVLPVQHATGTAQDPYAAKYPNNHVFKTASGHVVEFDDTPTKERIKVFHASGTFLDIDAGGNVRMKVVGNVYKEVLGDVSERIAGDRYCLVEGDNTLYVKGEEYRKSDTHIEDIAPRIDHN